MSIIIGSFNLYKFKAESNEKSKKDYKQIAHIIKNERFDIIALQEVFTDYALNNLLMPHLKDKYDCIWQQSSGKEETYKEGYAFIWNKDRFKLAGSGDGELYKRHKAKNKLVRPPLVARFIPVRESDNGFCELRLITTHMVFSKPASAECSDAEFRRKELRVLTEEIYPDIADDRFGDFRPAYTILMGDYNMCITKSPKLYEASSIDGFFEASLPNGLITRLFGQKNKLVRTVQSELTSLKRPKNDPASTENYDVDKESDDESEQESASDYYSKDYDHFSYDVVRFDGINVRTKRVDALGKYYNNDLVKYRQEISDHVPIKIYIDFKG